jgi:hypothetical protein
MVRNERVGAYVSLSVEMISKLAVIMGKNLMHTVSRKCNSYWTFFSGRVKSWGQRFMGKH